MSVGTPLEWFSAAQLAELSLPALPTTKQGVLDLAVEEDWYNRRAADGSPLTRSRPSRGGGQQFHVSVLPLEAREALKLRELAANDADTKKHDWDWLKRQPAKVRALVNSRLAVLASVTALEATSGVRSYAVSKAASLHGVSRSSVWNWLRCIGGLPEDEWGAALAPKYKGGKQATEIDRGAWDYLKSIYLQPSKQPWEECYREMVRRYAAPRGVAVPSSDTLKRKLDKEVPREVIQRMRYGRDAADDMLPRQRRSVASIPAMHAVNIDGHTFDVFVEFEENGKLVKTRPVLVGIADIRTRKILAFRIGRTENTALVRLALMDCFQEHGVPKKCTLDNGRAFASRPISGGSKTRFRFKFDENECQGILTKLGIDTHWTLPYSGRSKPIERTWKDLCNSISKHWKLSGAYTGNNPLNKPDNYGARTIPLEEFAQFVTEKVIEHNAQIGRRTEVCKGKLSFDQAFAASIETSIVRRAAREQLRLAFLAQKVVTLDPKTAEIRNVSGNRYWSEELTPFAGKKVIVRYDPDRLVDPVEVYSADKDAFICAAELWGDAEFYSEEDARKSAKARQRHNKRVKELVAEQELLDRAALEAIYNGAGMPSSPAKPRPATTALVQSKNGTTRALKHAASAVAMPLHDPLDDAFAAALAASGKRLRVVK